MTTIARRLWLLFFGLIFVFSLAISSFLTHSHSSHSITVGAKNCTEGQILSEIITQLIESNIEVSVKRNFSLDGTFITFNALKSKDIDLYVEYTGSAYTGILKKNAVGKKREEVLDELREIFLKDYNIVWLEPLGFQNTYALMVSGSISEKYGIKTLSDLKEVIQKNGEIRIGFDPEFYGRKEAKILEKNYGIPLEGLKLMDHTLLYMTLYRKGIEVINGYSTDGLASGLIILEDDQNLFPSYDAIPVVHAETLKNFPKLEGVLMKLGGCFSVEEVQKMNYAVEKKGESIYDVAHTFLKRHHLINEFSSTDH
ncbi:MAG: hypothetical protein KFB93_04780 [Simkaniaceae bacterium]|nr:MAG: hypothetical protein KFB93_04780 [Simkaniaceae bacterium]